MDNKEELNIEVKNDKEKKCFFKGKKKLIILITIGILIVCGIVLTIILLNRSSKEEELKYLSDEKYQEYTDKYGEKALKYIKSYLETYGIYPDSELVEEAINDKKVKCRVYISDISNSFMVTGCEIKGYEKDNTFFYDYMFDDSLNDDEKILNYWSNGIISKTVSYYLNNGTLPNNGEINSFINKTEDYTFTSSNIKFSDVSANSIEINNDNKTVKFSEFNIKGKELENKSYSRIINIENYIKNMSPDSLSRANITEKGLNNLASILKINIDIEYGNDCRNKQVEDGYLYLFGDVTVSYGDTYKSSSALRFHENDKVTAYVCKRIILDEINKEVDLDKISMSKEFTGNKPNLEKINTISKTDKFTKIGSNDIAVEYTYDGSALKLKSYDHIEQLDNIYSVYYFKRIDCVSGELILVSGNIIYDIYLDEYNESVDTNLKANSYENKNYTDFYNVYVHEHSCGSYLTVVAKSSDGKYYHLDSGKEINADIKYRYFPYLKTNREFNDETNNFKVKAVIYNDGYGDLIYLIDENNYLYGYQYVEENDMLSYLSLQKLTNKKVKKMYIKEDKKGQDYVYLQLEDGSFYEDSLIEGYVEY